MLRSKYKTTIQVPVNNYLGNKIYKSIRTEISVVGFLRYVRDIPEVPERF